MVFTASKQSSHPLAYSTSTIATPKHLSRITTFKKPITQQTTTKQTEITENETNKKEGVCGGKYTASAHALAHRQARGALKSSFMSCYIGNYLPQGEVLSNVSLT